MCLEYFLKRPEKHFEELSSVTVSAVNKNISKNTSMTKMNMSWPFAKKPKRF